MSRAVANTLLPAKRPASTIARPRPRELPVTNHTCAIQSSYLRSLSYFETARAPGNTVQQEIAIARPAERRAIRNYVLFDRLPDSKSKLSIRMVAGLAESVERKVSDPTHR